MAEAVLMIRHSFCLLALASLVLFLGACSSGGGSRQDQNQPAVIVVQAPPETRSQSPWPPESNYPGLAWQTPRAATPLGGSGEAGAADNPDAEPYDVVALLREFDPELTDSPKDQKGEMAFDDILSAHAVADDTYLYGRIVTRAPMRGDDVREVRFWIEQDNGKKMVTVELKIGSRGSPCELSDVKKPDTQNVVARCFWIGNAIDFRIPLDKVPSIIDTAAPFHVSGFQTCCQDNERNKPYDELEGAQGVWRVPGIATEVETK
jgi:hypothetical protein